MTCSLVITSDSAWVSRLQLWPAWSSACDMTTNPPPRTFGTRTLGASPVSYSVSQEKPWVITSRWLNWRCGAVAVHRFLGSKSVAIAYWSRSM